MAKLAIAAGGAAAGFFLGGPLGAKIGFEVGAIAGGFLFGSKPVGGPRLADLKISASSYGAAIPILYGSGRLSGQVIWATPLKETKHKGGGSMKGGPASSNTYTYSVSFGMKFCKGPAYLLRVWADSKLIYDAGSRTPLSKHKWTSMNWQTGTSTQGADPTMQSFVGAKCNANRDDACLFFTDMQLADYGNRIPNITVEVAMSTAPSNLAYSFPSIGAGGSTPNNVNYRGYYNQATEYKVNDVAIYSNGTLYQSLLRNNKGNIPTTSPTWWTPVSSVAGSNLLVYTGAAPNGANPVPGFISSDTKRPYTYCVDTTGQLCQRINTQNSVVEAQGRFDATLAAGETMSPTTGDAGVKSLQYGMDFGVDPDGYLWGWSGCSSGTYLCKYDPISFKCVARAAFGSPIIWMGFFQGVSVQLFDGQITGGTSYIYVICDYNNPRLYVYRCKDAKLMGSQNYGGGVIPAAAKTGNIAISQHGEAYIVFCDGGTSATNWWITRINVPAGVDGSGNFRDYQTYSFTSTLSGAGATGPGHGLLYNAADNCLTVITSMGALLKVQVGQWTVSQTATGMTMNVQGQNALNPVAMWFAGQNGLMGDDNILRVPSLTSKHLKEYSGADYSLVQDYDLSTFMVPAFCNSWNDVNMVSFDYDTHALYCTVNTTTSGTTPYIDSTKVYQLFLDRLGANADTLDHVVGDICSRAGLASSQYDVTQLSSIAVRGYVLSNRMAMRSALIPLANTFLFDGIESDHKLKFVLRGGASSFTINESDLGANVTAPAPRLTETRQQEIEIPYEVSVFYNDRDRNYEQGHQASKRIATAVTTRNKITVEAPIVFNASEARQIAEKVLYSLWVERVTYDGQVGVKFLAIDPGDVGTINYKGFTLIVRATRTDFGVGFVVGFSGVSEDTGVYTSTASGTSGLGAANPVIVLPANSQLLFFDIPLLQDTDYVYGQTGYYFAVLPLGDPTAWPGASLYTSPDNQSYAQVSFSSTAPIWGQATTTLAAPRAKFSFDVVNTVTIRLTSGTLASVTDLQMLNGANAALLGNEIIQFANVVQNSDGTYTLSRLLRGVRGTEWACGTHGNDETFVVLNNAVVRQTAPLALVGLLRYYKAVTLGGIFDNAVAMSNTLTGADCKPYAVAQLGGTKDGSNNFNISWIRRTRVNGSWANYTDAPLSEDSELYVLQILNGAGQAVRTVSGLTSPSFQYTAAMQNTDFGGTQAIIRVRVYQVSGQVGNGYPCENDAVGNGLYPISGGSDASSINGVPVIGTPANRGDILVYDGTSIVWQGRNRYNATQTTASIAANSTETGTMALSKSFAVVHASSSRPCRIRLYSTAAKRDADLSRALGTPIAPYTQHGLILELYLDSTGMTGFTLSPEAFGFNDENTPTNQIAYSITNMDTVTGTVAVTLTVRNEEE